MFYCSTFSIIFIWRTEMSFSKDDFMTESDRVALERAVPRSKDRANKKVGRGQETGAPQVYSWTPPTQPAAQAPPPAAAQPEAEATKKGLSLPKVELNEDALHLIVCLSIALLFLTSYLLGMMSGGVAFGVGAFMCLGAATIDVRDQITAINAFINALAFYGICNLLPNWPVPVVGWLCLGTLFFGRIAAEGTEGPGGMLAVAWWFVAIGLFIASLC
jgi:hypothetical protein